jgi:acyl-CoA thioester hydrolase
MTRPTAPSRDEYFWTCPITTRWSDNDVYHHVNNVVYYSYFDTVANSYLMEAGGLSFTDDAVVGFVVNSNCDYFSPIAFPQRVTGALRVDKLGNSSVVYGIAIFADDEPLAAASGTFTHVFVERESNRPVPIPAPIREALAKLERR